MYYKQTIFMLEKNINKNLFFDLINLGPGTTFGPKLIGVVQF